MFDFCFTTEFSGFTITAKIQLKNTGVYAVLGPSGAGKSSLLNILAGYSKISKGHICWKSDQIHIKQASERPIATLFQDNNLFPHLTVQQNLGLALTQWPWLLYKYQKRIEEALKAVNMSSFENRRPSQLSGGQKSRTALARVLLQDRPILLLDEPFSALGPGLKNEMLDLVARIANERNLLVLMVTHDPNDALRISKETILVQDGKVSGPIPTKIALDDESGPLSDYLRIK